MVHSDSNSLMTTNPSAPPQLTAPATEPLLHEAPPLVPPTGDNTGQDSSQPSILSTDLSQSSIPSSTFKTNPSPSFAKISPQTPALIPVNGRTSGRKRTPKACDCCGPNGKGHNAIKTYSRGRGRGRGKSIVKDIGETPKRKASQLTQITSFDLTNETAQDADIENNTQNKMQKTGMDAESQPHTLPPLPAVPLLSGSVTNCVENVSSQRNEDKLMKGTAVGADGGNSGLEMGLSGMTGRGEAVVRGRGGKRMMGPKSASNLNVDIGINKWSDGVLVVGSKTDFAAKSAEVLSEKKSKDAELESGDQTPCSVVKSLFENGDTVNLSDSEPEGDDKDNDMIMCQQENGLQSDGFSYESRSLPAQNQDSVIQVDQSDTLSNGAIQNHASTPMALETPHLNQGPVTVWTVQHQWALRDHRLYCQAGTWEKKEEKEVTQGAGTYGNSHNEEKLLQLTDMVHDFLESFYMKYGSFIPLSETDVVEHLKKHGNSDHSKWGLNIKAEVSRYRSGLASAPIAGFKVMHNKHNLSLEDLSTLEEQNWLNDQIINMYGELIMEATGHKVHFFNSFFHKQLVAKGYDGVKRWTKKVDLFSKWLLLIPIHLEIHWSLVTVTMATKTISYYDSQGIVFRHTTDNIMKYLQSEAKEKEQTSFQKGWKITIIKGIPQQKNDSDCGVFVLEYCRRLSVKQPLLFSQEDMPRIRKRIYKELCDCRFDA